MPDESNVFDLDRYRRAAAGDADRLPVTGDEYRAALAGVMEALGAQPADTPLAQARLEAGRAALRMALRLAQNVK